jgi:general L-amino acid transport system substrate-binding protein
MRQWTLTLLASVLLVLPIVACSSSAPSGSASPQANGTAAPKGRLATILSRGKLLCGVSGELPGFNPEAVEYRNLNAKERFTAVQTGEIDILSRNTTVSLSRDTSVGVEFAPVVFYDSQAIMVKKASGIKQLADFKGKSICLQTGTTHEQNLTDQMQKRSIAYKPLVFEDVNTTFATYIEGRCEGVTADRSQLVSRRVRLPNPDEHTVLDEVLSKEPLAPAVADGDAAWSNVVRWVVYALVEAEELNITAQNVASQASSKDPNVRRFLGLDGDLGKGMGLPNDFAARAIKQVGNYGEIYERNLGAKTKLNLPRGQNKLWSQGGLLFTPPFR